jgi:hypothetical protein
MSVEAIRRLLGVRSTQRYVVNHRRTVYRVHGLRSLRKVAGNTHLHTALPLLIMYVIKYFLCCDARGEIEEAETSVARGTHVTQEPYRKKSSILGS